MNNPNLSDEQLKQLLNMASKQTGISKDNLQNQVQNNQLNETLKNLRPSDAKKLQQLLQNPEMANQLLKSPQAKLLLKKLTGGK